MYNIIKKASALVCVAMLVMSFSVTAFAKSAVTYDGGAKKFIFSPGGKYSPTDLFSEFKNIMPGDSLTQKITVKNEASNQVKVKIYLRSLGADEGSEEFLSRLRIKVAKSKDNQAAYMFDAAADQTDGLTDWVCLGTLYSGGEVDLDVSLEVPVTMGNDFKEAIGYLDWQFKVEELPIESGDPKPPKTGDASNPILYAVLACSSALTLILLVCLKHRKNDEKTLKKF